MTNPRDLAAGKAVAKNRDAAMQKDRSVPARRATRALFLHRDLPFHGGVTTTFVRYAKYRDPARVSMLVASFARPSVEAVERLERYNVSVGCIGDNGYLKPAWALSRLLRDERIDVILANSLKAYVVAKLASVISRCRVVFRLSAIPLVIQGPIKTFIFRALSRHDILVFASRAVERHHQSFLHGGRSVVIHNGVEDPWTLCDDGLYPRSYRARLAVPTDALVLGYIAELIDWKDHDTLLEAFERLARDRPNLFLLLIGTGQRCETLRRKAAMMDQGDRVLFLGARNDSVPLLGLLDIYVHAAQGEGFGNAAFEAMASGLPAVLANAGMFTGVIRDGETALLCEPGNEADLAEKLERLIDDPELREKLGRSAREFSLAAFSPERFAALLTDVLEGRKK